MQENLPTEDDQFDPVKVYKFLKTTYAISDEAKLVQENPETQVLDLVGNKWTHGSLLVYTRQVYQRLNSICHSSKCADDSTQRFLVSLVLKHILDQVLSRQISVFEPMLQRFMPLVLSRELVASYRYFGEISSRCGTDLSFAF